MLFRSAHGPEYAHEVASRRAAAHLDMEVSDLPIGDIPTVRADSVTMQREDRAGALCHHHHPTVKPSTTRATTAAATPTVGPQCRRSHRGREVCVFLEAGPGAVAGPTATAGLVSDEVVLRAGLRGMAGRRWDLRLAMAMVGRGRFVP